MDTQTRADLMVIIDDGAAIKSSIITGQVAD
jgi:hypothetical protein